MGVPIAAKIALPIAESAGNVDIVWADTLRNAPGDLGLKLEERR